MVVWECCKDDWQSQWGMAKFDSQQTLKPNLKHMITSGISSSNKHLGSISPGVPPPHMREIYTKNLRMFTSFSFHPSPQSHRRARWTDLRVLYVIRRGSVQGTAFWGWENLILKFNWFFEKKIEKIIMAPMGNY